MTAAPGRGRFITFEGGEGAGKSTQIRLLADYLNACGLKVTTTREPGGTPRAERLREILLSGKIAPLGPLAEATLFAAARIDHVDQLIAPTLAQGGWVLSDRFADSTRAYQGARGGVASCDIDLLERAATGATTPDLTLILDLPPETGLARAAARRSVHEDVDRFEAEEIDFHHALRQAFLDIAAHDPARCCVIDAMLPPQTVAQTIRSVIDARLLNAAGQVAAQ
jgi:dTMP kinase